MQLALARLLQQLGEAFSGVATAFCFAQQVCHQK